MSPEDIGKALDEIGKRIGPYGEAAWSLLVNQMRVEGIVWTIFQSIIIVLAVTAILVTFVITRKAWLRDVAAERGLYDDPDPFGYVMAGFLISILPLVGLVVALGRMPVSVMKMLNPEYYALMQLLENLP